jgi:hypothetical protein
MPETDESSAATIMLSGAEPACRGLPPESGANQSMTLGFKHNLDVLPAGSQPPSRNRGFANMTSAQAQHDGGHPRALSQGFLLDSDRLRPRGMTPHPTSAPGLALRGATRNYRQPQYFCIEAIFVMQVTGGFATFDYTFRPTSKTVIESIIWFSFYCFQMFISICIIMLTIALTRSQM